MRSLLLQLGCALAGVYGADNDFDPLTYVDTLIGTANYGNGELNIEDRPNRSLTVI